MAGQVGAPEPSHTSLLIDHDGDFWRHNGSTWACVSQPGECTWAELNKLLGPVEVYVPQTGDGAADAAQTMGGSLPLAVPSPSPRDQLINDAARALCLDPHNGTACDMHRVDGALVVDALIAAGHLVAGNGEGSGPVQIGGQSGAASPFVPHRFKLHRHSDPSGVSGTGDVAEGVEFSDGAVALRWLGEHPSTAAWGDTDDVLHIHGHNGQTEIRWIDDRPIDLWPAEGGNDDD